MDLVFIDSSAWISYFVPTQPDYPTFQGLFKQLISDRIRLFSSNDVIDESYTRLRYDLGWPTAKNYMKYILQSINANSFTQLWTDEVIQSDAFTLLQKYSDHDLSLTDATSATLMKNFHIATILSLDRKHFTTLGFNVLP